MLHHIYMFSFAHNKLCFQLGDSKFALLLPADIVSLEADKVVVTIYLASGGQLTAVRNIGYYKNRLIKEFHFFELSKSVLVNPEHVTFYAARERTIQLSNGKVYGVANSKQRGLNEFFRQLHDAWLDREAVDFEVQEKA
jgi:DNA-binding LytR/AlgR family response regulator